MSTVLSRLPVVAACGVVAVLMFAPRVEAHITRIQIVSRESPTFGGYSWPGIGQYEKIVGKAFGEVDPTDGAGNRTTKGNCQQFQNPVDSAPVQRALFIALDEWSTVGTQPPPSQVPRLSDGTLVPPLPQKGVGLLNYGPNFYATGIPTINPPVLSAPYQDNPANGPIYPSFVPRTDHDGNDIAGVRLPDVTVPLATYTGWALRAGAAAGDGCEAAGQSIPFAKTKAERVANGDPRLSIEERYPSLAAYSEAVTKAIEALVAKRLMLREDAQANVDRLLRLAQATGALK